MNGDVRSSVALTLVAVWFGAALIVAASVAPAAFAVLPSRTLAGAVVGRVLPTIFVSGLIVAVVAAWLVMPLSKPRAMCAAVIGLACVGAQFIIGPRIAKLREEIGPALDALATDDPRRVAFGKLHAFSVGWMGIAMLAAAVLMILSLLASRQRS